MAAPTPPSLPLLPLPHPLVLFPAASLSVPISKHAARALVALIQDAQGQPLVAAVPILHPPPAAVQDAAGGATVLNEWGCAAHVVRLVRPSALQPAQPYLLTLRGVARIRLAPPLPRLDSLDALDFTFHPVVAPAPTGAPAPATVQAFKQAGLRLLDRLAKDPVAAPPSARRDALRRLRDSLDDVLDDHAPALADALVAVISAEFADKLDLLTAVDVHTRLQKAAAIFAKQASISEVSSKIDAAVHDSLSKQQKEHFLRQQLAAIQRELGSLTRPDGPSELDDDDAHDAEDMADVRRKIEAMDVGSDERKTGVREWRRLKRIPQGSVEHGVIRNYLEWLTALPWGQPTAPASLETLRDPAFLRSARAQLDNDHFGLDKVKRRLIEYLAIVRLKAMAAALDDAKPEPALVKRDAPAPPKRPQRAATKGPILLFVGPPGVGKTSLGQSVARALGRPFQRISLGGVRDEAEIRGHRRTYVASGPGLIVQALRRAGRCDPVLLLDEIDKIGASNFHGDPAAALLEVLDPEQNHAFNDHYINVPVDLSQVLFICTSNALDPISAPLLDRCEVIHLAGYTHDEKVHIAARFLLPKQLRANGLDAARLDVAPAALLELATRYTREAGVRALERAVGAVVRAKAVEWSERGADGAAYERAVRPADLERLLGAAPWDAAEAEREERRGVVYGLVVTAQGEGGLVPVEAVATPGAGALALTGSLGDVLKESGALALSWVKTHAYALCVTAAPSQDPLRVPDPIDVHVHLPAGAQRKDGPSAGITIVCALVSLLTGATVPPHVAMTGEITLRGRVTPVGGIKEKVLGAHRAKIRKVVLPAGNRKDVEHDVAREVRAEMEFAFVATVREALRAAFGPDGLEWRRGADVAVVESRL